MSRKSQHVTKLDLIKSGDNTVQRRWKQNDNMLPIISPLPRDNIKRHFVPLDRPGAWSQQFSPVSKEYKNKPQ